MYSTVKLKFVRVKKLQIIAEIVIRLILPTAGPWVSLNIRVDMIVTAV